MKSIDYFLKSLEYKLKVLRASFVCDISYRKKKHIKEFGRVPDFHHPQSLNEKINHRMIFDRNPLFTHLADKIAVRDYVREKIGEEFLIPVIAVYQKIEDIDFAALPDQFVLKCNHDSGSALLCPDKGHFDQHQASRKLAFCLERNMYYTTREWHYKNIPPRILCEEYIDIGSAAKNADMPEVYRIHCFSGKAHITEADFTDASGNEYVNVYDTRWRLLPLTMGYKNSPRSVTEPATYQRMVSLAERLADNIDYCRVDFLSDGEAIYFGEITLTPCNGRMQISPVSWDYHLGELWV